MSFWNELLRIFNTKMPKPLPYGWFHLLFIFLTVLFTVYLCATHKKASPARIPKLLFWVGIIVLTLEIYKQILFCFSYGETVEFKYVWYIFPWQLCSTPMYAEILAGILKKGRLYDSLCAYLATYAIFAGTCVMLYPLDAVGTAIGLNIQTMVCHGSMLVIGIYLLYSQTVKLEIRSILKALPVFSAVMAVAILLNEGVVYFGLLPEGQVFNMFFISRHVKPYLVLYSDVQAAVPYPWCMLIYYAAVTLGAFTVLLIAVAIKALIPLIKKEK
ncbi:MAG: hypothetical protein E7634_05660 [Ruminococcaceae bacterium]|nr:hypothetical protein [Oscillospiraceae bacterium]